MRSLGYTCGCTSISPSCCPAPWRAGRGVLWAYYNGFVSPTDVQLITSVEALLMVALGGPGTLVGSLLGAGVIVFLKNFVSLYTKRWLLILGGVYIGVILFAPRGVIGGASGAGHASSHPRGRVEVLRRAPRGGGRDAQRAPGRAPRPHRAERRRQDHAVQPDLGRRCR